MTNGEKEDPIKIHREATTLSDVGNHVEAMEKFLKASEIYKKFGNYFDASYTMYKAAECNFLLKQFDEAADRFLKAADLAFKKAFDRFGVSALEYARDAYKSMQQNVKQKNSKKKLIKSKKNSQKRFNSHQTSVKHRMAEHAHNGES